MSEIDPSKVKLRGPFQELREQLVSDRKKLMKEKAFDDPKQLRQFLGLYLLPHIEKAFFLLAGGLGETYDIAASNMGELRLLRQFTIKSLRAQGVEVPAEIEEELPDDVEEMLDEADQLLFKLGTLLSEKLPKDKETEETYNQLREVFDDLTDELLGADPEEGKPDDDKTPKEPPEADAGKNGVSEDAKD